MVSRPGRPGPAILMLILSLVSGLEIINNLDSLHMTNVEGGED